MKNAQVSLIEEKKRKQEKQDDFKRAAREIVTIKEIQKKDFNISREREKDEHNKLFEEISNSQVIKQRQYKEVLNIKNINVIRMIIVL